MRYIIYETASTYYMSGMKYGGYKSKGAATAALNRAAEKTLFTLAVANYFDKMYTTAGKVYDNASAVYDTAILETLKAFPTVKKYNVPTNSFIANRDLIVKANYSITDAANFHNNIEKSVERINLVSRKAYMERANTPNCCSPSTETYWSM